MAFKPGDVVIRNTEGFSKVANATIEEGTIGTICRVVSSIMYKVRFEDLPMCVSVFESSIRLAPKGTPGPECEADC